MWHRASSTKGQLVRLSRNLTSILQTAVAVLLSALCVTLTIGEIRTLAYRVKLLQVADNLVFICAGLSAVWAAAVASKSRHLESTFIHSVLSRTYLPMMGGGLTVFTVVTAVAIFNYKTLSTYDLLAIIVVGVSAASILKESSLHSIRLSDVERAPGFRWTTWAVFLLTFSLLMILLRLILPTTLLLTWFVAPVYLFFLPGLFLGLAVLPQSIPLMIRLIAAAPLAICIEIIIVLWLEMLGISLNYTVIYIFTTSIGAVSLTVYRLRKTST